MYYLYDAKETAVITTEEVLAELTVTTTGAVTGAVPAPDARALAPAREAAERAARSRIITLRRGTDKRRKGER